MLLLVTVFFFVYVHIKKREEEEEEGGKHTVSFPFFRNEGLKAGKQLQLSAAETELSCKGDMRDFCFGVFDFYG